MKTIYPILTSTLFVLLTLTGCSAQSQSTVYSSTSEATTASTTTETLSDTEDVTTELEEDSEDSTTEETTEFKAYTHEAAYYNLYYGNGSSNNYDLYIPTDINLNEPQQVILFLHGGGWKNGVKEDMNYLCNRFTAAGFLTATMNYTRYATDSYSVSAYTMMDEIDQCIQAIQEKTQELGITVNGMALSGNSAGGHLAMLYTYSQGDKAAIPIRFIFQQVGPTDFHKETWGFGTDVTTMFKTQERLAEFITLLSEQTVTVDDLVNDTGNAEDAISCISPYYYINADTVPTILSYGALDETIGTIQQNCLLEQLERYGVDHTYILFENSDHNLENDPDKIEELYNTVLEYANKYF